MTTDSDPSEEYPPGTGIHSAGYSFLRWCWCKVAGHDFTDHPEFGTYHVCKRCNVCYHKHPPAPLVP